MGGVERVLEIEIHSSYNKKKVVRKQFHKFSCRQHYETPNNIEFNRSTPRHLLMIAVCKNNSVCNDLNLVC